jgi:SAM-dependent methyltransferase
VDARAFNPAVWQALLDWAAGAPRPLRVLDAGGGSGAMAARILGARLPGPIEYTLVDQQADNMAAARAQLGEQVNEYVTADVFDFLAANPARRWDLLVAHAFLDLIDLSSQLPPLLGAVLPTGAIYAPINFDGQTTFAPEVDSEFEQLLLDGYHATMRDPHTGRHLAGALAAAGVAVRASGGANWVVEAQDDAYPADEAYFLDFMLYTIEQEMRGRPEIDEAQLDAWLDARRAQVEAAELRFSARNLDYFAVLPA